jgi:hypothetical protein
MTFIIVHYNVQLPNQTWFCKLCISCPSLRKLNCSIAYIVNLQLLFIDS